MVNCVKPRILFILKNRSFGYGGDFLNGYSNESKSSGLWTSANLVYQMLVKNGFDASLVDVNDGNDIDREVTKYRPTTVILEALFVTPEKVAELASLHRNVKWIVRLHSEVSFVANEGIFSLWSYQYVKIPNVSIAANSKRMQADLEGLFNVEVGYLPNYYDLDGEGIALPLGENNLYKLNGGSSVDKSDGIINVCCFGAIRPLKNQLQQAISAIHFANKIGKTLHFHINATRIENNGDSTIKNIRNLFIGDGKHQLKEHLWQPHRNFINTLKLMDIGMQVSMSETYNIVTADMIMANIPVVTSSEVMFVSRLFQADPTDSVDITNTLLLAWGLRKINAQRLNKCKLIKDAKKAESTWLQYFN